MNATYRSFAKINLHLEVLGLRPDGYHELRTVFQTVELSDRVSLDVTGRGIELEVSDPEVPADESNLAHRAASLFLSTWPRARGVRIRLEKQIPTGGGLGGGSSNAASVLQGLRDLLSVREATTERLDQLARELGADVPFFLEGGTALGSGRGDQIRLLPDLPEREVWLVTPPVSVSTAAVFRELRELTANQEVSSMGAPAWEEGIDWEMAVRARNDLETLVTRRFPVVNRVYNALVERGARIVRLSGSGATWFAWFDEPVELVELESRLPSRCRVFRTRTLNRNSLQRLRVVQ